MQLFAAGFCLMIPQAHAMPMSMQSTHAVDMGAEHCAEPMQGEDTGMNNHAACSHCDQPDEFWQNSQLPVDVDRPLLSPVFTAQQLASVEKPALMLTSLVPTGPPRSSSIIYTTTKRIRI